MLTILAWILKELAWPYCIMVVMCFMYVKFSALNKLSRSSSKQNVLFITAHPDDECMFFSPTILSLLREGHNIYLVCVTKGDYYGLGDIRRKELQASCTRLGIMPSHVTVIDDDRFKDGPENVWDLDGLGERILSVIKRVQAESIITFDKHGVSGHTNHISVYKAVDKLFQDKQLNNINVFVLETTNIVRKYMSFFDIPCSSLFNMASFVSLPSEVIKTWQAMAMHNSQMVWFRKLYIVFSRYIYVNTYKELR
ncbi:hypothetical protein ACF0H5_003479 [Mactra antiquata]